MKYEEWIKADRPNPPIIEKRVMAKKRGRFADRLKEIAGPVRTDSSERAGHLIHKFVVKSPWNVTRAF